MAAPADTFSDGVGYSPRDILPLPRHGVSRLSLSHPITRHVTGSRSAAKNGIIIRTGDRPASAPAAPIQNTPAFALSGAYFSPRSRQRSAATRLGAASGAVRSGKMRVPAQQFRDEENAPVGDVISPANGHLSAPGLTLVMRCAHFRFQSPRRKSEASVS